MYFLLIFRQAPGASNNQFITYPDYFTRDRINA